MPVAPYPTLSESGFVEDPRQKIEWIFSDYTKAKYSQSMLHYGHISSLSFDEFDGNYEGLKSAAILQRSLTTLYSAYFDTADIEVTDDSIVGGTATSVIIKGMLSQNGQRYQLNENLSILNGKVIFIKR